MRKRALFLYTMATLVGSSAEAFAAAPPQAYKTGVLAIIFFGFSTIVVVAQLIPAIITIFGIIRGFLKRDSAI